MLSRPRHDLVSEFFFFRFVRLFCFILKSKLYPSRRLWANFYANESLDRERATASHTWHQSLTIILAQAAMGRMRYFSFAISFLLFNDPITVEAFNPPTCALVASALYIEAGNVTFLRDQNGRPTNNFSDAWGISYEACNNICTAEPNLVDWSVFTNRLASWLLPCLMLLVQLPFQSASIWKNLQELLLATGNPILIIYSLAVTIFNTQSIKKAFRELEENTVLKTLGTNQGHQVRTKSFG